MAMEKQTETGRTSKVHKKTSKHKAAAAKNKVEADLHSTASAESVEIATDHDQEFTFWGSSLLKEKAPKAFELTQVIAAEWVKDGDFSSISTGYPIANKTLSKSLLKAKNIEKKLEEKGVISGVRFATQAGLEFVKAKLKKA